jgi:type IV secretion system protein VirB10
VTEPVSDYEVKAGDVITAVLVNGLNSDAKGMIKAQVTRNVLDHATGTHILIPQGATLIGYYDTEISYGQTRLEAGFDRIIFPPPGDESLRLSRTPGSDVEGYAGLHDITEDHLGRIVRNALLAAAFSAGIQLSQPRQNAFSSYNPGQVAAGAVGQQANAVGSEFIRRGLNIPPTEVVRNGYPFTILVKEDIAFSRPWQPTPLPSDPIRLVDVER